MLKSDRLVCEKNATIARSVTNYNLYRQSQLETNLSIVRVKITTLVIHQLNFWSFVIYERPILDDEPKPHKFACLAGSPLLSHRPRND